MSETVASVSQPETSASGPPRHKRYDRAAFAVVLAIFLLVWARTGAHFMADTAGYVSAILTHYRGLPGDDYHRITANLFWDFGHLLWRPIGWVWFSVAHPLMQRINSSEWVQVTWSLLTLSLLSSFVCVAFFFLLARNILKDAWAAALSTLLLFFSDAFLNYSHAGAAYPSGLACLVVGMYFSASDTATVSWFRAGVAGLMFALSVLFWLPYIFVLPAAFVTSLLLQGYDGRWRRMTALSIAVCAVVGLTAYGSAIALEGISNWADLRAWILAAGHGQMQVGGLRAIFRLAFAFPRSFVNMGRYGMLLKRYLVHDPYAPERLLDLLRLSFLKLGFFYISLMIVCIGLLRSKRGRVVLLVLATAVVPVFFFSLFIFEAGSVERYLPLYPFIFLAWGYVLANRQVGALAKSLMIAYLVVTVAVNVNAMRRGTLQKLADEGRGRIRELVPRLTPASFVLAVNEQDSLAEFCHEFPLDPLIADRQWQNYDVLEINAARIATWREDLAARVLWSWRHGGTVWVPLRFLHERPDPHWNWVEGDDPRVHWSDLPAFFSRFDFGPSVGGPDGFIPLTDDPANERILMPLAAKAQPLSEH